MAGYMRVGAGCVTVAKSSPSLSFAFLFTCHQSRLQLRDVSADRGLDFIRPHGHLCLSVCPSPSPARPCRASASQTRWRQAGGSGAGPGLRSQRRARP